MIRYTVTIEGMQCGMCEAHVNNAVRNACPVKKVSSSHATGQTVIISREPIDERRAFRSDDRRHRLFGGLDCQRAL